MVSMPPRRSCFPSLESLRAAVQKRFQCHHGVPASVFLPEGVEALPLVSMPPRRSCFIVVVVAKSVSKRGFNATTAFLLRLQPGQGQQHPARFNATTAFLLRTIRSKRLRIISRFNATTAFLLPRATPRRIMA
jgi:hypothetical protein